MHYNRFRLTLVAVAILVLSLALVGNAMASAHGQKKPDKTAILLVTFGTSIPAAQKSFARIDQAFKKAFPGVEIRWAYTAKLIRRIVAKKQGKTWLSPAEALAKLMDDGYTQVVVQSLHVIPGAEFHDVEDVVHGFRNMGQGFRPLMSWPLCATANDLKAVAKALLASQPAGRKANEAVVYMGHGTHHPGGVVYAALSYLLQLKDRKTFMGTVEGYPTLDDIVAYLKAAKIKKAYLLPFMTVAGDHATNDMAGPEPDSWKSVLKKNGITAVPMLKSIIEIPAIVDIYVQHAKACFSHFK